MHREGPSTPFPKSASVLRPLRFLFPPRWGQETKRKANGVGVIEDGLAVSLAKIASCWDNFCTTHTHALVFVRPLGRRKITEKERRRTHPGRPGCFYGFWLRCLRRNERGSVCINCLPLPFRFNYGVGKQRQMHSGSKYVNRRRESM